MQTCSAVGSRKELARVRVSPIDIVNRKFSRSRTGYSAAEVDDFLRELAEDFEAALGDSARMQQRLEALERDLERFEAMETTLKEALVLAQSTANSTRALAQQEAESMLRSAQSRADETVRDAVWRSEKLRQERLRFGWEFRALLQSQLDHLDAELQYSDRAARSTDDNVTDVIDPPAPPIPQPRAANDSISAAATVSNGLPEQVPVSHGSE